MGIAMTPLTAHCRSKCEGCAVAESFVNRCSERDSEELRERNIHTFHASLEQYEASLAGTAALVSVQRTRRLHSTNTKTGLRICRHLPIIPQRQDIYPQSHCASRRTRAACRGRRAHAQDWRTHCTRLLRSAQLISARSGSSRSWTVNGRDKVISLKEFEVTGIEKKVQLLLDSSGAKIKPLKKPVESTTEAARGIWSGLHAELPRL